MDWPGAYLLYVWARFGSLTHIGLVAQATQHRGEAFYPENFLTPIRLTILNETVSALNVRSLDDHLRGPASKS